MNLKDWQAMSSEEQTEWWDRASEEERSSWATWAPLSGASPPTRYTLCCQARDTLIKQLNDEVNGVLFYSQMAGELGILGETTLQSTSGILAQSDALNHIADDEFRHYLELRGIIEILTEQCSCSRETIEPPFGK